MKSMPYAIGDWLEGEQRRALNNEAKIATLEIVVNSLDESLSKARGETGKLRDDFHRFGVKVGAVFALLERHVGVTLLDSPEVRAIEREAGGLLRERDAAATALLATFRDLLVNAMKEHDSHWEIRLDAFERKHLIERVETALRGGG